MKLKTMVLRETGTGSDNRPFDIHRELGVTEPPSSPFSVTNKAYVDSLLLSPDLARRSGDILVSTSEITPAGYLRCNGSELSKVSFANLYNAIGDKYSNWLLKGSGRPSYDQYLINNTMSRELYTWVADRAIPVSIMGHSSIITLNAIYIIGGRTGGTFNATTGQLNSVYRATIASNGVLGTWTLNTALPVAFSYHSVVVFNNNVYVLGGSDGTNNLNTVYRTAINSMGDLGSWTTLNTLPAPTSGAQALITTNRILLIGGSINAGINTITNQIHRCDILPNGNLSGWTHIATLPIGLRDHSCCIIKDKLYVIGGVNFLNAHSDRVWRATITPQGELSNWTELEPLPLPIARAGLYVSNKKIYIIGGMSNTTTLNAVYTANINLDGTISTWYMAGTLINRAQGSNIVLGGNSLYQLGGTNGNNLTNLVHRCTATGGTNNLTNFNIGEFVTTSNNNFRIPDFSKYETDQLYMYIKI